MRATQRFSVESCMKRAVQVVPAVFRPQSRYHQRWSSSSAQFAADRRIIAFAHVLMPVTTFLLVLINTLHFLVLAPATCSWSLFLLEPVFTPFVVSLLSFLLSFFFVFLFSLSCGHTAPTVEERRLIREVPPDVIFGLYELTLRL